MIWKTGRLDYFAEDMFSGMERALPHMWKTGYTQKNAGVLVKRNPTPDRFAVIISGGAGNGPLFPGYVAEGLADAASVGGPFSAPNAYAKAGLDLSEAARMLRYANTRLGTISVHVDHEAGEVYFGSGFSGEPPMRTETHMDMERTAEEVAQILLEELKPREDETLFVLVNRLRLTSYADSYIMANLITKALEKHRPVAQLRVAAFSNITDKYGFDFSVLCMDGATAKLMDTHISTDSFTI